MPQSKAEQIAALHSNLDALQTARDFVIAHGNTPDPSQPVKDGHRMDRMTMS